jgi:SAM-dependent methyltransferase
MTKKTDWDQYYRAPFPAARWTRRITTRALLDMLSRALGKRPRLAIAEIGGANSCFLEAVVERLRPDEYHIVDNNTLGLGRTKAPAGSSTKLELHQADVLDLRFPGQVDCVFSVGLIEHFDNAGTRRAVQAHFDILKPGGIALISFPTPTPLYRVLRFAAESAGLWKFPDERPLELEEVASAASRDGDMLEHRLVWQIGFTQRIAVFRKRASHVS